MHPLRKLRESGNNTIEAVTKILAENVVLHNGMNCAIGENCAPTTLRGVL